MCNRGCVVVSLLWATIRDWNLSFKFPVHAVAEVFRFSFLAPVDRSSVTNEKWFGMKQRRTQSFASGWREGASESSVSVRFASDCEYYLQLQLLFVDSDGRAHQLLFFSSKSLTFVNSKKLKIAPFVRAKFINHKSVRPTGICMIHDPFETLPHSKHKIDPSDTNTLTSVKSDDHDRDDDDDVTTSSVSQSIYHRGNGVMRSLCFNRKPIETR
jgi:hypothetical protein